MPLDKQRYSRPSGLLKISENFRYFWYTQYTNTRWYERELEMHTYIPPTEEELTRIEAQLLDRMANAEADYQHARAEVARLSGITADIGLNHFNGRAALPGAACVEREAAERYKAALHRYNYFVSNFKIPRDL
jgi:hypothetical protein